MMTLCVQSPKSAFNSSSAAHLQSGRAAEMFLAVACYEGHSPCHVPSMTHHSKVLYFRRRIDEYYFQTRRTPSVTGWKMILQCVCQMDRGVSIGEALSIGYAANAAKT